MLDPKIIDPKRLDKLRALCLLDTPIDPAFDRLTRLASNILNMPVSLVSLVDAHRQFFKSQIGLPEPWATLRETPLSHSFCQHVVATGQPLIITDAREHPLVQDNLAIRDLGVIAYAGMPLTTSDGYELGSFCVIQSEPHQWTDDELNILADLAASVMTEIELQNKLREYQESEAQLLVSEARYRQLSELMSDYAFSASLSSTGKMQLDWVTEEAFTRLTGYTTTEALQLPNASIMIDDYTEQAMKDVQATLGGEIRKDTYLIQTKQGKQRWLQVDRYPQWNETQDQVIGFYGIARDVTEDRLIQQKKQEFIAEQERANALRQFITDVSHDFRTPLSIIQTNVYLLKQLTTADKHGRLALIADQATRIDDLVENLTLMSRLDSTTQWRFDLLNINRLVADVQIQTQSAAQEKDMTLVWQPTEDLPSIQADSSYLSIAVQQLINNAIQFTSTGGQITIRTYSESDHIVLEVEDTGIGIDTHDLPYIFDRFFRADSARSSNGGIGMGLAMVKQIIDNHHGSITVTSVVNQGSIFCIHLPIAWSDTPQSTPLMLLND